MDALWTLGPAPRQRDICPRWLRTLRRVTPDHSHHRPIASPLVPVCSVGGTKRFVCAPSRVDRGRTRLHHWALGREHRLATTTSHRSTATEDGLAAALGRQKGLSQPMIFAYGMYDGVFVPSMPVLWMVSSVPGERHPQGRHAYSQCCWIRHLVPRLSLCSSFAALELWKS